MASGEGVLDRDYVVAFPPAPTGGLLGVLVRADRVDEFRRLELENRVRIWRVRGIVSDHIPLTGDARSVLAQSSEHNFFVNNPPLSIYLHGGGANAIYYDLAANAEGKLSHIEVRVETNIPGKALILAWRPLNALLDALVRNSELPWALSRNSCRPRMGKLSLMRWYYLIQTAYESDRSAESIRLRHLRLTIPFIVRPWFRIARSTDCSAHFASTTVQPKLDAG